MFDADKGKEIIDRLYNDVLEREDATFWYEPWNGVNTTEAWERCIADREGDMLFGNECDVVAYLATMTTDWFYDGVWTLAILLDERYLAEHEVKE